MNTTQIPLVDLDTVMLDATKLDTVEQVARPAGAEPQVGVSACLVGQLVRYNGGHSQSKLCLDTLTEHFNFVPFCPEVAAGFGTPRPTMRLMGSPEQPALTWTRGETVDLTAQLEQGFQSALEQAQQLDGYILKAKSPSCGLHKVKLYQLDGQVSQHHAQGLYAAALQKRYPQLPMEDEGRLNDARLRENFILRVFAYHNFKFEVLSNPSVKALMDFHKSYKYVLMAHSQIAYRRLGRMLAQGSKAELEDMVNTYIATFTKAVSRPANNGNHANTLMHILGYLKKVTPANARKNIAETILKYRNGLVPLVTPMTLLNHYVQLDGSDYIKEQRYLQPYPESLGLTNHI